MSRTIDLDRIIDRQDGSDAARARVRAFLRMAAGEASVDETALALGLSPQRVHELRERMVAGALAAAEPKPPGRPRQAGEDDPRDQRIRELEHQVTELHFELECAFLRTELARAFGDRLPSLKNEPHQGDATDRRPRREQRERERRGGAGGSASDSGGAGA